MPDGKSLIASVGVRQSSVWMHDAAGNHAVSLEGSAETPRLSPDGKRLYYLLRKSGSSNVSELWRRDLASGKCDPVLTGQRIVDYDISRDESRVAFTVLMGDESQIFLATTDRSAPPRLVVRGGDLVSFGAGQLFFRQLGGKADYLARVQEDGSGLTRILDTEIVEFGGVSPDGEWATVGGRIEPGIGTFAVGVRTALLGGSVPEHALCSGLPTESTCTFPPSAGCRQRDPTSFHCIIPVPRGFGLLKVPASGIDRASEAEVPGIQSIPQGDVSPRTRSSNIRLHERFVSRESVSDPAALKTIGRTTAMTTRHPSWKKPRRTR